MADAPEEAATPGPRSKEEILADPQLRAQLAGYEPTLHDLVLQEYARLLADLHRHGALYEQNLEALLHQHSRQARKYLWLIQYQKLFDLECQWRAELVEVPEARLTADFDDWHNYIEECPVLPPISPEEVDLLSAFIGQCTESDELNEGNFCNLFWMRRQHPNLYSDDDEDAHEVIKPFTHFWDLRRGTGYLRRLPNPRGEREQRYLDAVIADYHRQQPPATPHDEDDALPQAPTFGPAHDELMRDWLRQFEPAARQRQFEAKLQLRAFDASEGSYHLALALERLRNAGPSGPVPIDAHADWREAIIAAGHRHYLAQVRAALPGAYADYCQRQQLGISHEPPTDSHRYQPRGSVFAHCAERIRRGRRLLGEPDDLDF
ncbi:hypothetical protein Q5H93_12105 [Hymenobacter sp. ASUV-10]|uniref:Uncharacterized protein n=1 Tax=Hymenobacter aranciens TaxID=3063996 RepID=A0ABT9BBA6_9BACT|nr:hypothetical protein [Hymenobacter sp. ASUV-10]MDO7875477.1 hypothetical protein [Hymenobacter sp. ASUV-10]